MYLTFSGANNNLSCTSSADAFFSGSVSISSSSLHLFLHFFRFFDYCTQSVCCIMHILKKSCFPQSTVPGIQEALSKFGLLAVIDDLEQRKKVFVNVCFVFHTF